MLFVVEVTLAFFWWKSAEKAAMLGARLAVVQDIAAANLPHDPGDVPRNEKSDGGLFGMHCRPADPDDPSPCVRPDTGKIICENTADTTCNTWVCAADTDNAGCDLAAKTNIVRKMQNILAVIQPEDVEISYRYVGLGYAGGPLIPAVTVTLTGLQFQTGFISLIGGLFDTDGDGKGLEMPPITATLTGEDLSSAAAGA